MRANSDPAPKGHSSNAPGYQLYHNAMIIARVHIGAYVHTALLTLKSVMLRYTLVITITFLGSVNFAASTKSANTSSNCLARNVSTGSYIFVCLVPGDVRTAMCRRNMDTAFL